MFNRVISKRVSRKDKLSYKQNQEIILIKLFWTVTFGIALLSSFPTYGYENRPRDWTDEAVDELRKRGIEAYSVDMQTLREYRRRRQREDNYSDRHREQRPRRKPSDGWRY